jgi:hypothetical protein
MPFAQDEIRWGLACGVGPDGHWHGWFDIRVHADALRRLGLHPEQPTAEVVGRVVACRRGTECLSCGCAAGPHGTSV